MKLSQIQNCNKIDLNKLFYLRMAYFIISMKFLTKILQIILYSNGPFYCYPWKPIINYFVGDGYPIAYQHFRRDHHGYVNVTLHLICLCLQVCANYSFLALIDEWLETKGWGLRPSVLMITVAMWVFTLLTSGSPTTISIISSLFIFGALFIAPHIDMRTLEVFTAVTYLIVFVVNSILGWGVPISKWVPAYIVFFGVWIGIMDVIEANLGGIWADNTL